MTKREQLARALASGLLKVCSPSLDKDIMEGTITSPDLRAFWVQGSINLFDLVDIFNDELREPDEKMLTKGHAEGVRRDFFWERITEKQAIEMKARYLPTAWQAMIDAIE